MHHTSDPSNRRPFSDVNIHMVSLLYQQGCEHSYDFTPVWKTYAALIGISWGRSFGNVTNHTASLQYEREWAVQYKSFRWRPLGTVNIHMVWLLYEQSWAAVKYSYGRMYFGNVSIHMTSPIRTVMCSTKSPLWDKVFWQCEHLSYFSPVWSHVLH